MQSKISEPEKGLTISLIITKTEHAVRDVPKEKKASQKSEEESELNVSVIFALVS